MERLRQCSDLPQRLEHELIHISLVGQDESRQVLMRIARSLGISTAVANLFALPEALTPQEYIAFVLDRVAEFAPLDIKAALDKAEAAAFNSPVHQSLGTMASQLSQWQRENDVVPPSVYSDDSDDGNEDDPVEDPIANGDVDDDGSEEEVCEPEVTNNPRNDDDASDSSDASDGETANESEDASEKCHRLLQDPVQLSKFSRQLYDMVNNRGDSKIDMSQIQPFLDYLVNHNFNPARIRSIVNDLATREFAQHRELNYVKFCVFVRYVLQRYVA